MEFHAGHVVSGKSLHFGDTMCKAQHGTQKVITNHSPNGKPETQLGLSAQVTLEPGMVTVAAGRRLAQLGSADFIETFFQMPNRASSWKGEAAGEWHDRH